ncbi:MAG: DUF368 domain-containing protein [Planctomycetota bacterium]
MNPPSASQGDLPAASQSAREQRPASESTPLPVLALRGGIGGVLMGLANLVPGISGGTMLLAAGVYPRFIAAIGEVTTLRFRKDSLIVLGSVVLAAVLAILLLAGTVKSLVVDHRWVMYALFIGLTLGGVPVVWKLISHPLNKPAEDDTTPGGGMRAVGIGAACGFIGMAALALFQSSGAAGDAQRDGFVFLLLAGIAGASAMILPGVSGGYLLLVLGVYVPILAGISAFKGALPIVGSFDSGTLIEIGLKVVLPVGLGVLIGVVGVSNLLRWLLKRYEKATLGVLLGLLVGAVVGLWPFQQTVDPVEGQLVKGQSITLGLPTVEPGEEPATQEVWMFAGSGELVEAEDLPTSFFTPSVGQVVGSVFLIVLGLVSTLLIDRFQGGKPSTNTTE